MITLCQVLHNPFIAVGSDYYDFHHPRSIETRFRDKVTSQVLASKWWSSGHQPGLPCLLNNPFGSLGHSAACREQKPGFGFPGYFWPRKQPLHQFLQIDLCTGLSFSSRDPFSSILAPFPVPQGPGSPPPPHPPRSSAFKVLV